MFPRPLLTQAEIASFVNARNADPHSLLGMHLVVSGKRSTLVVRAFLRDARTCELVETGRKAAACYAMDRLDDAGLFEVLVPRRRKFFSYRFRVTHYDGRVSEIEDPYRFLPTLSEQDLYLFGEGNEHRIYEKLGAHLRTIDGIDGVSFAVWAPNAARVSAVGNFNEWDGRYHPMRPMGASGIWELFVPGLGEGELYKFEIRDHRGNLHVKTDPYGTRFEAPPGNASIVCEPRRHAWGDGAWMARRKENAGSVDRPISIYEVHLGSWRRKPEEGNRVLSYRELAPRLADYCVDLGFTHVELMPIAEHPFDGSWGYQVTGFFAPTHRFGTPEDFCWFVDYLHQRGLGVILDWVPAHFPRDAFALAEFDGTHLYEHADPRQGAHMDWGTLIFNYARNEVRGFLVANALAWLDRYHIDGLRVDAVASMLYLDYSRKPGEWIPNEYGGRENLAAIAFLRETNRLVHQYYPGALMIAEESTAFEGITRPMEQGGIGFDLKWNMGWMHDTLLYFQKAPVHRKWHHNHLTFAALYQYTERFVTVFSHDEVVHGKGSLLNKMAAGSIAEKATTLRALYAYLWTWPGKKLLFMGGEFGQSREWAYAEQLDWALLQYIDHEGIRLLVRDLNRLYTSEPALSRSDFDERNFRWINCQNADDSVVSYLRLSPDESTIFLVVGHYSGAHRTGYRVGVPRAGHWREVINTNSAYYGGHGEGNDGGVHTQNVSSDGQSQSLELTLPPLSTFVFRWEKNG